MSSISNGIDMDIHMEMDLEDNDEICQNLRTGEYRLMKPLKKNGKSFKSCAWKIWHCIVNDNDERVYGKIACVNCYAVKDYNSNMGTTNLTSHKLVCLNVAARKSLSALSTNEAATVKSLLKKKVVQFVAQVMRLFRTSSGPGFLSLADTLIAVGHRYGPLKAEDVLPHRTTISKDVSKDAEEERLKLKTKMIAIQSQGMAITIDLWTEDFTKCHYIGMNVHYIVEGVMTEDTLSVKELDELSANADNIHTEIINMLFTYGIDIDNVVFVSDRGAEIKAALKDVAYRLNCGDHLLNNIVDHMFEKISPDNEVTTLKTNCHNLVKYVKQSKIQYQLSHSLKNEVKTRWNTKLTMFKSIKKAQETDHLSELLEKKNKSYLLSSIDNPLLDAVEELLEPFLEATLYFEAKSRPTIHYVALYRMKLEKHLIEHNDDRPEIVEMKYYGLQYLREKWILDDTHKKAVFFHPKLNYLNMLPNDKDRVIADIRQEVEMLNITANDEEEDTAENEVSPPKRRKRSENPLLQRDSIIDEFYKADFNEIPTDEVQKYIDSPVIVRQGGQIDICEWWYQNRKVYPALYKLSLKYLCIPASSATAESKFSLARFVVNERRVTLDPSVVDDILVLKSAFDNQDLLA